MAAPRVCWLACETNFVYVEGYLEEIIPSWNIPKIQGVPCEKVSCDFKWQWSIPRASHQNGVGETLIKSQCPMQEKSFYEEQWRTFLSETTYIIKGRPLHPSSNNNWVTPPFTPNDILINQNFPPPQPEPEEGSTSGSF